MNHFNHMRGIYTPQTISISVGMRLTIASYCAGFFMELGLIYRRGVTSLGRYKGLVDIYP